MKKTLLAIAAALIIGTTAHAETEYVSMVCAVINGATLEQMAQIEQIIASATGDEEPYFSSVYPKEVFDEQTKKTEPEKKDI